LRRQCRFRTRRCASRLDAERRRRGRRLFGGCGSFNAALLGALVIGAVQNGLNLMGVENEVRLIVTGLLLVLAVSIDKLIEKATGRQAF
jgi:D-xylose transport system permease protein